MLISRFRTGSTCISVIRILRGSRYQREHERSAAAVFSEGLGSVVAHSGLYLDMVAEELNDRPRKTLGWQKPVEVFAELLESSVSL